jgi:hypothetical protein
VIERLQQSGNDPGLRRFHIPTGILHKPGRAQKGDRNTHGAQALFGFVYGASGF